MEKVEFVTKTTYAYERLKREIMDGTLGQGEKLVVNAISQRYQVSPMPDPGGPAEAGTGRSGPIRTPPWRLGT